MDQNIDSSGVDQIQSPQYPKNHHLSQADVEEVLQDKEKFMQDTQTFLEKFNRFSFEFTPRVLTIACERIDKIKYVLTEPEEIPELMYKLREDVRNIREELAEYIDSLIWNCPIFFYDEDEEYTIQYKEYLEKSPDAVTTVLSNEEPEYSLSMGYEHPNTTSETKSDEIIKSGVEELVPIQSECEVTLEDKRECDMLVCENSPIFDDHYEFFSDSNNDDDISSDDDAFEDIEYVEASLSDPETVNLEEENDNFGYDSEGDIRFLKELLIDDSIPFPNNESSSFEDDLLFPRPPPEPPDAKFDLELDSREMISAVMNTIDELNKDDPGGEFLRTMTFLPLRYVSLFMLFMLCTVLYPFTECHAQPYFFSCFDTAVDGFGYAGVAADGLSFFVGCVLNFCRGIVETIVFPMSSMMLCEGVPAKLKELQSMAGETVMAKAALFLEKMMDKEGNREWQLRDLGKESREMAFEIESFLLKLMDEESSHKRPLIRELRCNADSSGWTDVLSYFYRKAVAEDRRFATQLNTLSEEMVNVCEKRRNLDYKRRSVKGIIVTGKVTKFVIDTLRKDDAEMAQLRELERQMELRALKKELFIQKLVQNASECMCLALEAYRIQAMAVLPICDELRQTVNSLDWEVMFILCCRRKIAEDLRLSREINALCARVNVVIDERENLRTN
nr:hypothetical protein [Tanacetum cinerariifolium]